MEVLINISVYIGFVQNGYLTGIVTWWSLIKVLFKKQSSTFWITDFFILDQKCLDRLLGIPVGSDQAPFVVIRKYQDRHKV